MSCALRLLIAFSVNRTAAQVAASHLFAPFHPISSRQVEINAAICNEFASLLWCHYYSGFIVVSGIK